MRVLAHNNKFGKGISPVTSDQVWLLALLAAGSFVFAMVTVFVVSMFVEIRMSAWSVVGSIAPWYLAVMGGWINYFQVPLFVANGRTRKSGFREWRNTGIALAPIGAVLMAIGFLVEKGIYNLANFTTESDEYNQLHSTGDFFNILFQYLLTFAVWFALGGFIGAALYRAPDWGWVSIPVAIGIASVSGIWNHSGGGFFAITRRIVPGINYASPWLDLALSSVAVAIGVLLAWRLIHDLPLRNP